MRRLGSITISLGTLFFAALPVGAEARTNLKADAAPTKEAAPEPAPSAKPPEVTIQPRRVVPFWAPSARHILYGDQVIRLIADWGSTVTVNTATEYTTADDEYSSYLDVIDAFHAERPGLRVHLYHWANQWLFRLMAYSQALLRQDPDDPDDFGADEAPDSFYLMKDFPETCDVADDCGGFVYHPKGWRYFDFRHPEVPGWLLGKLTRWTAQGEPFDGRYGIVIDAARTTPPLNRFQLCGCTQVPSEHHGSILRRLRDRRRRPGMRPRSGARRARHHARLGPFKASLHPLEVRLSHDRSGGPDSHDPRLR